MKVQYSAQTDIGNKQTNNILCIHSTVKHTTHYVAPYDNDNDNDNILFDHKHTNWNNNVQ